MTNGRADADLANRLQNRDPDALATAYDRYGSIVYSVFYRITRERSAAEDLVQELFMRVWNNARYFDATKGSLGVWILSIARNMGIDYVRSAHAKFATRLRPIEHASRAGISAKKREPEAVIDQVRTVKEAFSTLNENQKRVLELAYFEGFSQTEIAAQLQEPLGTVKSWTRSALGRLRTAVKGGVIQ